MYGTPFVFMLLLKKLNQKLTSAFFCVCLDELNGCFGGNIASPEHSAFNFRVGIFRKRFD